MQRISSLTTAGTLLLALALAAGAQAAATDRNHDRIPDRWERAHHLTLRVNQAKRDQDRDGLVNRSEYRDHTDPHRKDSDRDGVLDGQEDADHDGVANAVEQQHGGSGDKPASPARPEPVATVASFDDDDVLRVRQADGTILAGTVDDATRLLCAPPVEHPTAVVCLDERLMPGTPVLVARKTNRHWDLIVLRSVSGGSDDATTDDEGDDEGDGEGAPPPAPPVVPPAPPAVAAPASTGVVTKVGDGSITITRPSGEVVPGFVRSSTVLRCVRVADGHVVANEPCSSSHLAVGRPVALAQRAPVDGGWAWTAISLIEPAA
ncbi:MAG: hypothetical protein QOG94_2210 [Solirubrobacteraceae bacterium]|jgi:hypothetical protein|nr:hypothetical protein [Solirubrobacteraceae bacterium]